MKTTLAVALLGVSLVACGQKTQRLGRDFSSMDECMSFINSQIGPLKPITDKLGHISGHGDQKLFFICETQVTGSKGIYVQGRWDFPVFEK